MAPAMVATTTLAASKIVTISDLNYEIGIHKNVDKIKPCDMLNTTLLKGNCLLKKNV